ncbi:hypothetical protein SMD20_48165 [Nonomuraea sp. LP-02]|uniref:hypothetical protein n=1 Tax=Nonomuraea sp. LP-02 TaxID=3097960 RepID=UPI002E365C0B|nr:hypothetical protein [Nonomuraea sp. LP-02]MED7932067.1 hypothetical protein [Nonomuraea sp. LP-02]
MIVFFMALSLAEWHAASRPPFDRSSRVRTGDHLQRDGSPPAPHVGQAIRLHADAPPLEVSCRLQVEVDWHHAALGGPGRFMPGVTRNERTVMFDAETMTVILGDS